MGPEVPGERLTSLYDLSATDELSSTRSIWQWQHAMNSVMTSNTTSLSSAVDVQYKLEIRVNSNPPLAGSRSTLHAYSSKGELEDIDQQA